MIQGQGIACRQLDGRVGFPQLLNSLGVQSRQVVPLPHGGSEPAFGVVAKSDHSTSPVGAGGTFGPRVKLQDVQQKQVQEAFDRVKLRKAHVLDLLGDVGSVHVVRTLAAPEAMEQINLAPGPGQDVVFVWAVWHGRFTRETGRIACWTVPPRLRAASPPIPALASAASAACSPWQRAPRGPGRRRRH